MTEEQKRAFDMLVTAIVTGMDERQEICILASVCPNLKMAMELANEARDKAAFIMGK